MSLLAAMVWGGTGSGPAVDREIFENHRDVQPVKNEIRLPAGLGEADVADGWIALFDGESLFGWRAEGNVDWQVVDGTIQATQGEVSLLRTTTEFDDYELKLDFRATSETNSGVFLRTSPKPRNATDDCYELNIASNPRQPFPTGSLVQREVAEALSHPDGQWHTFHVTVDGNRISVKLNDKPILDYQDTNPLRRGFIGLQSNSGPISFRNIRLKPLGLSSLVADEELAQWDFAQTNDSLFSMNERRDLEVHGGPGQLESKQRFANFVLSTQCRTNAAGLNSGIFFRSIPGDYSNGYESQIQNQFHDDDRTRPVDCGTGGIFRRANARYVNADDQRWFQKTIIANGPHLSVWVNGLQVTDWTDRRSPHSNPRRGLRKKAGTIILQGHDPTTDIQFREINIRELAPRR